MLTPAYAVTLGAKSVDTATDAQTSTIVDIAIDLDLDVPADRFVIVLGAVGTFKPQREDKTSIRLGYTDDGGVVPVIAGSVASVERGLLTTRVTGYSAAHRLLRTYVAKTFGPSPTTAGAITHELARLGGVPVDRAEDGDSFPSYAVDQRRSAFAHIRQLARQSGFDVYVTPEGKLVFERFTTGKTVHVFEFAKHLLALEVREAEAPASRVEAWGEGSAGSHGVNAWPWLTKDFRGSRGSAGSGDPLLLLENPALRSGAAAGSTATAVQIELARRELTGTLTSLGRPQVRLGDAIALRAVPDASLNGTFQVRSIAHRLTKTDGFTTTIGFRSMK